MPDYLDVSMYTTRDWVAFGHNTQRRMVWKNNLLKSESPKTVQCISNMNNVIKLIGIKENNVISTNPFVLLVTRFAYCSVHIVKPFYSIAISLYNSIL